MKTTYSRLSAPDPVTGKRLRLTVDRYEYPRGGKVAGGVYMWESQEAAERFYSGEWLAGIRARYGTEPKITYFETVALTDKASGQASGLD